MKRFLTCAILALTLTGIGRQAGAGTVVVTDSGNIGGFTFTNAGIAGGTARIDIDVPGTPSQLNTVNGALVTPELVVVNTPAVLLVTPIGGGAFNLALVPSTYTKTIGDTPGAQAVLAFDLLHGVIPGGLPDFFNASGNVTGVLANLNPLFDFHEFDNGLGSINLTFTATSFGGGATDFASLFSTPGATAVGNGSFSQVAAVPGPTSAILMGLGFLPAVVLHFIKLMRRRRQSAGLPGLPVH